MCLDRYDDDDLIDELTMRGYEIKGDAPEATDLDAAHYEQLSRNDPALDRKTLAEYYANLATKLTRVPCRTF